MRDREEGMPLRHAPGEEDMPGEIVHVTTPWRRAVNIRHDVCTPPLGYNIQGEIDYVK